MAACQPEHYREVYPEGNPEIKGELLTQSVLFGTDSVRFRVTIDEKQTPLSQLQVKVMVGGAPVTQGFADEIGADGYSDNANSAVAVAKQLLKVKK